MRVGIIALGSRGDVQPYVALGKGLKLAVTDHEMKDCAASLGEMICGEDGVGNAVWLFQEHL